MSSPPKFGPQVIFEHSIQKQCGGKEHTFIKDLAAIQQRTTAPSILPKFGTQIDFGAGSSKKHVFSPGIAYFSI